VKAFFSALVGLVAPAWIRQSILGDLEEEFHRIEQRHGRQVALRWYARESVSLSVRYAIERWRRNPDVPSSGSSREGFMIDIKQALRNLRRSPGFTIVAVTSLAVGIGVTLSVYALIDAVLFRPLSAVEPHRLVRLGTLTASSQTASRFAFSYSDYVDLRSRSTTLTSVTVTALTPLVFRVGESTSEILGEIVSGDYFPMLHVTTTQGRLLALSDDFPGAPSIAVISRRAAERHLPGRDPIGATIVLSSRPFTVVGIAPTEFGGTFLGAPVDAWLTVGAADGFFRKDWRTSRKDAPFAMLGRLALGANRAQAQAELDTIAASLAQIAPAVWRNVRFELMESDMVRGALRRSAVVFAAMLAAMSALVLLIVCTNVINLLVARGLGYRRQLAIRLALGASRWRLASLAAIECFALTIAAAAAGLALASVLSRFLSRFELLPTLTLDLGLRIDGGVWVAAAVLAVATGTLLGIIPAIQAARPDVVSALTDDPRVSTGSRRTGVVRSGLVVAQIAASVLLLSSAGLFARSLINSSRVDLGFVPEHAVAIDIDLSSKDLTPSDAHRLHEEIYRRLRSHPGIVAVAFSNRAPIDTSTPSIDVIADDTPFTPGTTPPQVTMYHASAEYFEAISMSLVSGRPFNPSDNAMGRPVAIVNETMAERFWPTKDAVGMLFRTTPGGPPIQIVGIARNSRYRSPGEQPSPHVYLPFAQSDGQFATLIVKHAMNSGALLTMIQRELERLPVPVEGFFGRTLVSHLRLYRLPAELAAVMAAALGVVSLLLATIGLYGLIAYIVSYRTMEIGIRMALGASPQRIRAQVLGNGIRLLIPGVILGLVGSFGIGRVASNILFGIGSVDPVTMAGAVIALSAAVLVATYLPARRAMRIDPVEALRR
jgi:predicted permease